MPSKNTTLTIITPLFDKSRFIWRAIESVKDQYFSSYEHVILLKNNIGLSSKDLKRANPKLRIFNVTDNNIAKYLNYAIHQSRGQLIGILNHDEIYMPGVFKKIINKYSVLPKTNLIYGVGHFIDKNGKIVHYYGDLFDSLVGKKRIQDEINFKTGCNISLPTIFINKQVFENVGYYNEKYKYAYYYDFLIRAKNEYKFYRIPEHLAATRYYHEREYRKISYKRNLEYSEIQKKYFNKVHHKIIFYISELSYRNSNNNKQNILNRTKYLFHRISHSFALYLRLNHEIPPLRVWYYYLVWIKEIVFGRDTWVSRIINKATLLFKLISYLAFDKKHLLSRTIYDLVNKEHFELGRLYQHKPKQIIKESFPDNNGHAHFTFAIVTPSFNHARYITETIKSVINQRYPKLQYIVQDGGSTDKTSDIIKKFKNPLIQYQSRSDRGQSHAINLGFAKTTGEIMAYLNSDDLLMSGCLQYVDNYFYHHKDVDVIYGHRLVIDTHTRQVGKWILYPHNDEIVKYVDFVPQETMFWRRTIWNKIGGHVDENLKFAMDWDLLQKFIKANAKIVRLPYILGMFRIHDDQKTSAQQHTVGLVECQKILKKYHGRVVTEDEINELAGHYVAKSAFASYLFDFKIRI